MGVAGYVLYACGVAHDVEEVGCQGGGGWHKNLERRKLSIRKHVVNSVNESDQRQKEHGHGEGFDAFEAEF